MNIESLRFVEEVDDNAARQHLAETFAQNFDDFFNPLILGIPEGASERIFLRMIYLKEIT